MRSLGLTSAHRVLDVGCGYGLKMKALSKMGLSVVGIDLQPEVVRTNNAAGMDCMTADQFARMSDIYDLMLFSHVIEHFAPDRLLEFMDTYLDRLKAGGYVIIATPLMSSSFYDDFDHIKPYQPIGINMVFNGQREQVKYYSRHVLDLRDIWFRRSPFRLTYHAGLYVRGHWRAPVVANVGLALLFRASFGLIGRTTGWMGLYKKVVRSTMVETCLPGRE